MDATTTNNNFIEFQGDKFNEQDNILHMEIGTLTRDWCWQPVKLIEAIRTTEIEHRQDYH